MSNNARFNNEMQLIRDVISNLQWIDWLPVNSHSPVDRVLVEGPVVHPGGLL
jgi:hypothetical protein